MDDVIMLKLCAVKEVSEDTSVFRYLDTHSAFYCPHRGQGMGICSDPAGSLDKVMGITGIPSLENQLDTPEHLA